MLQDLELEEAHKRGVAEGRREYMQHMHDAEVCNKLGNKTKREELRETVLCSRPRHLHCCKLQDP